MAGSNDTNILMEDGEEGSPIPRSRPMNITLGSHLTGDLAAQGAEANITKDEFSRFLTQKDKRRLKILAKQGVTSANAQNMPASSHWTTLLSAIWVASLIQVGYLMYQMSFTGTIWRYHHHDKNIHHIKFFFLCGNGALFLSSALSLVQVFGVMCLLVSNCKKQPCFAMTTAIIFGIVPVISFIDNIINAYYHKIFFCLTWCFYFMSTLSILVVAIFTYRALKRQEHLMVSPQTSVVHTAGGGVSYPTNPVIIAQQPPHGSAGIPLGSSVTGQSYVIGPQGYSANSSSQAMPPAYNEVITAGQEMYPKVQIT